MTDEPRHDYQAAPGYAPEGDAAAEPWGAHPETGEEQGQPDATAAHPEPVSRARIWPRIVGVLLLFVIVGGVWIWQNPGFVQSSLRWFLPNSAAGTPRRPKSTCSTPEWRDWNRVCLR